MSSMLDMLNSILDTEEKPIEEKPVENENIEGIASSLEKLAEQYTEDLSSQLKDVKDAEEKEDEKEQEIVKKASKEDLKSVLIDKILADKDLAKQMAVELKKGEQ